MNTVDNNQITVSKLNVDGENLYIQIFWENTKECLFNMKLYERHNSWSGHFTSDYASILEEPEEEYNSNVKNGLLGNSNNFIFKFVHLPGACSAQFNWKKVFDDGTEMPYGSVKLQLEDESKDSLVDYLINENKELKSLVELNIRKNADLSNKVEKCQSELEQFVNEKISLESNLYGKFVQLLNEKKERIRLLEESIQNMN
ncbi:unnamed protein product [Chilo suppressalis]|uniref:GOLD domain-containing protein n=1 Tax=Chilo suppressalis TaxID=168631 RepID=A0ABN8AXU4_CHISP|nr:unnamed protein product [Chilo suppressalis]